MTDKIKKEIYEELAGNLYAHSTFHEDEPNPTADLMKDGAAAIRQLISDIEELENVPSSARLVDTRQFDLEDNEVRINKYGCSNKPSGLSSLQYKWRNPETIPDTFDMYEVETAILDAFIAQGGAHVWFGDGSSCAAQIVQAVWLKLQAEIKKLKDQAEINKQPLAWYDDYLKLEHQVNCLRASIDNLITQRDNALQDAVLTEFHFKSEKVLLEVEINYTKQQLKWSKESLAIANDRVARLILDAQESYDKLQLALEELNKK